MWPLVSRQGNVWVLSRIEAIIVVHAIEHAVDSDLEVAVI